MPKDMAHPRTTGWPWFPAVNQLNPTQLNCRVSLLIPLSNGAESLQFDHAIRRKGGLPDHDGCRSTEAKRFRYYLCRARVKSSLCLASSQGSA
jgi:hypothetical protein